MAMKRIAIRYVWNGNFLLDFITFFPFNLFYINEDNEDNKEELRHLLIIKLIRMAVTCAKLLARDYGDSRIHRIMRCCWQDESRNAQNKMD